VKNLNTSDFHLPYNPKLTDRAKELRKNLTPAESKLWHGYLKSFKYRVLRQRPIDHFIVDFYCHNLKLVIEIDGESHFTEEAEAADGERTQILESYGLKVIRFTNQEVLKDFEAVCKSIEQEIPVNNEVGEIPLNPPF
jgi:very-short-patch-repair endonuclease